MQIAIVGNSNLCKLLSEVVYFVQIAIRSSSTLCKLLSEVVLLCANCYQRLFYFVQIAIKGSSTLCKLLSEVVSLCLNCSNQTIYHGICGFCFFVLFGFLFCFYYNYKSTCICYFIIKKYYKFLKFVAFSYFYIKKNPAFVIL